MDAADQAKLTPPAEQQSFSEHFDTLRTRGNWEMNMAGSTAALRLLVTPGVFARRDLLYLESVVLHHRSPAGFYLRRQNYRSYQLLYTLSGRGVLEYMGGEYVLEAGDCAFLDCRVAHCFRTLGDEPWVRHGLQCGGHQLASIFAEVQHEPVRVQPEQQEAFARLFERIAEAGRSYLLSADILVNSLLTQILTVVLLGNRVLSINQTSPKITAVCSYIEASYGSIRTLDDVAAACYMSKYYLCREFRAQTGSTVMEYLTTVRINAAKTLLLSSTLSVSEIATECGFSCGNYFFSVFRKKESITPMQFRRQYRF